MKQILWTSPPTKPTGWAVTNCSGAAHWRIFRTDDGRFAVQHHEGSPVYVNPRVIGSPLFDEGINATAKAANAPNYVREALRTAILTA